jgi:hypothetical protein
MSTTVACPAPENDTPQLPEWLITLAAETSLDSLTVAHHTLYTLQAWQTGD